MTDRNAHAFRELARLVHLDDDAFWTERDRALAERQATHADRRRAARAPLLQASGFPADAVETALSSAKLETPALRYARQFAQSAKRILVLAGGVGTGKTSAAAWLSLDRLDPRPGFIRAPELARRWRRDVQLQRWLCERSSLVLDDLGVEVLDERGAVRSVLDELFDRHYSTNAPLIITANLDAATFGARYGDRVVSRFQQRGAWVECGTRDLRKELLR